MQKTSPQPSQSKEYSLKNYIQPSIASNSHIQDQQARNTSSQSSMRSLSRDEDSQTVSDHEHRLILDLQENQSVQKQIEKPISIQYVNQMSKQNFQNTSQLTNNILNSSLSSINYRKMMEIEVQKCRVLEKTIYSQNNKIKDLYSLVTKLKEQNRLLSTMVEKSKNSEAKKNQKIRNIDQKITKFKAQCKNSSLKEELLEKQVKRGRKQRKKLREQNQKYRIFVNALYESMGILNRKKIDNLPKLWDQWKQIFQQVSLGRCLNKANMMK